ncbi:MAG: AMP-binding protein [bacterium]|nr:AMP-binding protein [bacterium]
MPDQPLTLGPWLRSCAERHGDREAIEVMGEAKSYAALDRDADRLAAGLTAGIGLVPGDRAAVVMRNSLACVDAWFAMARAGIVDVPVNVAQRGDGLAYVLGQSRSQAVVCDIEFADRLAEVIPELPELRHVVLHRPGAGSEGSGDGSGAARMVDTAGAYRAPAPHAGTPSFGPGVTVHELPSLYRDATLSLPSLEATDTAVILYTSGTTGPPKGAMLSHAANLRLTRHTRWLMGYGPSDVLYTAFPLFHINARYTTVTVAMEAGARCVLEQRFSAGGFWDTCRTKGVTAFNYMGALLMMLWKQPARPGDADHPVRRGFGAPCPPDIWEPFEERFDVRLTEVYGSTEVPIVTQNGMAAAALADRRIGTAGRPSGLYDMRIVDEDGTETPPGTAGEIVVRSQPENATFSGYYDMSEATAEAWRGGWFHTGDRGVVDADGYLTFIDRMKDCVRRRGENISSWEVEQAIARHPAVLEAAVVGVPSELSEEEVLACLVLKPDRTLGPDELIEHCAGRMAHFAVPRYIRWMDELPRNASERVQKFQLRAEGLTPGTWDRLATERRR